MLNNNSAYTDGAPGATIIIKKVNCDGFTFSWIKAHVVAVRKTRPQCNSKFNMMESF